MLHMESKLALSTDVRFLQGKSAGVVGIPQKDLEEEVLRSNCMTGPDFHNWGQ